MQYMILETSWYFAVYHGMYAVTQVASEKRVYVKVFLLYDPPKNMHTARHYPDALNNVPDIIQ